LCNRAWDIGDEDFFSDETPWNFTLVSVRPKSICNSSGFHAGVKSKAVCQICFTITSLMHIYIYVIYMCVYVCVFYK
jgi:hypothetical protein